MRRAMTWLATHVISGDGHVRTWPSGERVSEDPLANPRNDFQMFQEDWSSVTSMGRECAVYDMVTDTTTHVVWDATGNEISRDTFRGKP